MTISRRTFIKGITAAGAVTLVSREGATREPQKAQPGDLGMLYDSTLCIGCRACVTSCKEANGMPPDIREFDGAAYDAPDDLSGSNLNIIKMYQGEGESAYVKMQCMHCIDPACVSVCMAGALHKIEGGIVAYNKDTCVGCRYCQVGCPFDVPKFMWNSPMPRIVKCELCRHRAEGPACCEVCPRQAVIFDEYDVLLQTAHARIEADPKRYDPEVYGENDGGGTHVLYLTSKEISFEKLGLPNLPDAPLPTMSETVQHAVYKGMIAPVALYGLLVVTQFRNRRKDKAEDSSKEESHD